MWSRWGNRLSLLVMSVAVLVFALISPATARQGAGQAGGQAAGHARGQAHAAAPAGRSPRPAAKPSITVAAARASANAAATASATNSGSQKQCFYSFPDCASVNPEVVLSLVSDGDTSACTFQGVFTWGDGKTTTIDFAGAADGVTDATVTHTYSKPGSYGISWRSTTETGTCSDSSGTVRFTLVPPLTPAQQGGAANPSENQVNCPAQATVNCATGVLWHTFTDFSIPGRGVPIDLTSTYASSRAATNGPFGYGWTDSYGMSLARNSAGDVTITQEDGSTVTFTPDGSGYTAPPYVLATLAKNANGSYTFTRDRGRTRYNFAATGRLTSESDLNGYVTRLSYNTKGQLTAVTDPAGRSLAFTYSGSHVATVTDPMGRTWKYRYDSSGNLTSATDPMGRTWSFSYDAKHRLLAITDPRGGKTASTYNSAGQVVAQTDPDGGKTTWSYSGNPATLAGSTTTMTDPDGHVTVYEFSDLEMVSVTRAAGTAGTATTRYVYDPLTLGVISKTDPDGNTTASTYDAEGSLLTTTDPLGDKTAYTYNSLNEVLTETDPLGAITRYAYNADGDLLTITDPLGHVTTYAYADKARPGDVTSVTDPDGHVTSYTYDSYGDVASVSVFPSSAVTDTTTYAYDKDGERTCAAEPNATAAGITCPVAGSPAKAGTTATAYNADGEVTSVTDPDGHVTRYAYDADGDQLTVTNPAGQVTSYVYNGDGEQTKIIRPGGSAQETHYDADGNVISVVNAAGDVTRYAYDAPGQLVSVTGPLGDVTKYAYDLAGYRTALTDAEGQVTTYAYDKDYDLTAITYSDGTTPDVRYTYDADGRRASMTDGTGTTTYAYDADGHLTRVTDGAGTTVSYRYDAAGLLISLTYPNGSVVTRTYDGAGQLVSVTDWLGHSTTAGYDRDGNLTLVAYPNGVSVLMTYDKANQLMSVTDELGSVTLASFTYTRNSLGDVVTDTETGSVAGTQRYSYTPLNQLAADSAGSYGYDAAGDLIALPGGVRQAFNADGQLTSTTTAGTPAVTTAYAYNKDGDRTGAGATSLTYNQANELTAYGTAASYAYNGDGLLMSETAGGIATDFAWDQSGSVPLVIAAGSMYYVYGPGGRAIEQVTGSTPGYLLADQSGSTRLITNSAGAVTGTYTYGPYGTVTGHTGAATALGYDGQYTDAESGLQYLRSRYYDPATGQFLTPDPLTPLTGQRYGYAAGNPVNVSDPAGQ